MKKKQMSVRLEDELHKKIEEKTGQLGISKSSFMAFASSFFLHQLEHAERAAGKYSVNVYELMKNNLEQQNGSNSPDE